MKGATKEKIDLGLGIIDGILVWKVKLYKGKRLIIEVSVEYEELISLINWNIREMKKRLNGVEDN